MKAMETARCATLGLVFVVMAGCATQPRHFLDPADRSPVGGREAVVLVPQGEIKTLVVASQAGAAFGLVGAIIDVGVNQHRANAAEKSITPLRTALTDYHFDQQALAATEVTVARMDWLAVRKTPNWSSGQQEIQSMIDRAFDQALSQAAADTLAACSAAVTTVGAAQNDDRAVRAKCPRSITAAQRRD
jgi:hypothetical protein